MSVYLVGAGPGDADLLTVRAARLLGDAEVVVRDRLVDPSVLDYVNPLARVIDVGEHANATRQSTINDLLVELAGHYDVVVRLKGGDPFIFGRGGEEVYALRAAGVEVEVVPGVSSALAGPVAAGIPLTHRGVSHGVVIVSATAAEGRLTDLGALARDHLSLVILMGVARRAAVAEQLQRAGLGDATPVAVVERAWTRDERTTRATLGELAGLDVRAPAIIVVGAVAALDVGNVARATSESVEA